MMTDKAERRAESAADPLALVEVYTVTSAETAELIRATLQSEGIRCWIEGESQAGLAGVLPISLLVRTQDVDAAFRVIKTFDH